MDSVWWRFDGGKLPSWWRRLLCFVISTCQKSCVMTDESGTLSTHVGNVPRPNFSTYRKCRVVWAVFFGQVMVVEMRILDILAVLRFWNSIVQNVMTCDHSFYLSTYMSITDVGQTSKLGCFEFWWHKRDNAAYYVLWKQYRWHIVFNTMYRYYS